MSNNRQFIFFVLLITTIELSATISIPAQTGQQEPHAFLKRYLGFTQAELDAMDRGQIVVKLPKTGDSHELATFGVVWLNITKERYVNQFRDIVNFKRSSSVPQIGVFHNPPRLDDLRGLTLEEDDVEAAKKCRIGDCGLKLPAKIIERLQKEVNWSAPNYREQVDRLVRQALIDYVREYLRGGNAALGEYHDQKYPLRLADEFRALLRESPFIYEYAPEFRTYLEQFPNAQLPGAENLIYWSKEKFGLKPVLSLTHVTIYRLTQGKGSVLIASKQIYASHYFEASLGLTALVDRENSAGAPGVYLMYLNRSRADALRGDLGGLKRSVISRKLLSGTEDNLRLIKRRLESVSAMRK